MLDFNKINTKFKICPKLKLFNKINKMNWLSFNLKKIKIVIT